MNITHLFKNTPIDSFASDKLKLAVNFLQITPTLAAIDLKTAFSQGLGYIVLIAFFFGVIKIIGGGMEISRGNPDGKSAIIGGIIIAGAPAIMYALFKMFGMEAGALTPKF